MDLGIGVGFFLCLSRTMSMAMKKLLNHNHLYVFNKTLQMTVPGHKQSNQWHPVRLLAFQDTLSVLIPDEQ
jgi:hypothetical protein